MTEKEVLENLSYWVNQARQYDYSNDPVDQLLVLALKSLNGALKAKLESN